MNTRIKTIRKELKLTQQNLADALNISKSTVEGYEYGRLNVTDRTVSDICRLYNVNEEWLRTGAGEMFKPKDREAEIADIVAEMFKSEGEDFRLQLVKLLYEMDAEEIAAFKNIVLKIAAAIKKDPLS